MIIFFFPSILFSDILSERTIAMTRQKLSSLRAELQNIRKNFRRLKKYRLETEAAALISSIPPYPVAFKESRPLAAYLISNEKELSTQRLTELLKPYSDKLGNSDFSSLMWQIRYALIIRADRTAEDENAYYCAGDIDCEKISNAINPMHLCFSEDEAYRLSTPETRSAIRFKAERIAAETGIPESRLSKEYMKTAKNNGISLCEAVSKDYTRVFPYEKPVFYIAALSVTALLITAISVLCSDFFVGTAVFLPALSVSKTIIDRILLRNRGIPLAAAYTKEEAEKHGVVCVLSVLASSPDSIEEGLLRLKQAKIRNNSPNIRFCLLCDLPPAKERTTEKDEEVLNAVNNYEGDTIILVRHRDFSRTQELYQGKERNVLRTKRTC